MDEIEINYLVAEHLYPRDFPDFDPVRTLQAFTADDLNNKEFKEFNLLSDKITFKDNGFWKKELLTRWPEKLEGVHERAMLTADHFAKRMDEFKRNGDLDNGKKVCYLVFSHGMMVLQFGNMIDQMREKDENDESIALPNPVTHQNVTQE